MSATALYISAFGSAAGGSDSAHDRIVETKVAHSTDGGEDSVETARTPVDPQVAVVTPVLSPVPGSVSPMPGRSAAPRSSGDPAGLTTAVISAKVPAMEVGFVKNGKSLSAVRSTASRSAAFAGGRVSTNASLVAASPHEPPAPEADEPIVAPVGNVKIPVAFEDPSPARALTGAQQEEIVQVQEEFIRSVGGVGRSPEDPDYRKDWQTERWRNDQLFRARFGNQAALERQIQANLNSSADPAP